MASIAEKKDEDLKALRTNEKKWGKPLMKSGWTAFPSIILEKQHALGIDSVDVNIILYLATYWWEADNMPHPAKGTIAETIGLTPRTIQRRIAALEQAGLVERVYRKDKNKGNKSNMYNFDGLIKELAPFAEEKVTANEDRRTEAENRRKRKKAVKKVDLKAITGGKKS